MYPKNKTCIKEREDKVKTRNLPFYIAKQNLFEKYRANKVT
mgnify:CR=1 FL=1